MIALLLASLFILAPFFFYIDNAANFVTPAGRIFSLLVIPALVIFLLVLPFCRIASQNTAQTLAAVIATLGILVWMQSTVLLWDHGILDGRIIQWNEDRWRGLLDGTLWIAALVFACMAGRTFQSRIIIAAVLVFALQAVTLAFLVFRHADALANKSASAFRQNLPALMQFASEGNVVHIVLDGFQSDVFNELLAGDETGNRYRESFQGFVYYRETLGVFPYTLFSVPAFLSEKRYSNAIPKDDFIDAAMAGQTILSVARDAGYEVDVSSGYNYMTRRYLNLPYNNIFDLKSIGSSNLRFMETALTLDLALFRMSPYFIKPYIYNGQRWLISRYLRARPELAFPFFTHSHFLRSLSRDMTVERQTPVYKYFHVLTTHNPMVVNSACQYENQPMGMQRENFTDQSRCTLDSIVEIFARMKALGIYDDALIILHSDHGGWVPNIRQGPPVMLSAGVSAPVGLTALASPLLAIKRPNNGAAFSSSDLHVSLLQLPATINNIMNWKGQFSSPAVDELAERGPTHRRFRFHSWESDYQGADYTGPIYEFSIDGSHYESEWQLENIFHPPQ